VITVDTARKTVVVVATVAAIVVAVVVVVMIVRSATAPMPAQTYTQCVNNAITAGNDPALWCQP
jgi:hypothetical protein